MKTSHGGKREGAGKPKGRKWESTLEKEAAREFVRQAVTERLELLLTEQIDNAVRIRHLIVEDPKTGDLSA